jgi:predicted O-methyltransferase YrrM
MTKESVIKHALTFTGGGMSQEELEYLYDLCKDKTVLELGSMYGQSSYVIASVAKHLTCVDAWEDGCPYLSSFQRDIYSQFKNMEAEFDENMKDFTNVTKLKGLTTEYEVTIWLEPQYDIVLVDADHSYEGVIEDIKLYHARHKEYIVFHDYGTPTWPGVKEAVDNMLVGPHDICGYLGVFK